MLAKEGISAEVNRTRFFDVAVIYLTIGGSI